PLRRPGKNLPHTGQRQSHFVISWWHENATSRPFFQAPRHIGGCGSARSVTSLPSTTAMAASPTTSARSDLFPFELVRPELERVEASIREQVRAFDPAVEPYVAYICNTSGKRI